MVRGAKAFFSDGDHWNEWKGYDRNTWRFWDWNHWRFSSEYTLDRAVEDFEGRDDLALCHVLNALPNQLLNPVTEPMINPTEDLNRLSEEGKKAAAQLAGDFRRAMNQAVLSSIEEKTQAVLMLQEHLGQRLSANYEVISVDATVDIRTIPPAPGPRPLIPATKAG